MGGFGGGHGGMGRMRFEDESAEKPKLTKQILVRIMRYFMPFWKQMILAVIAILLAALLGLVPPIITRNIVDVALPQKSMQLLFGYIATAVGTTLLLQLLHVGQSFLNTWIAKHIIENMKNQMYAHLQDMSLNFFSTTKPGEITTRMTNDIDGIQDVFNSTVINVLNSIFVLTTTAIVLVTMNWKLAIVGMAILPLFIFPTRKVGKFRWKLARKTQETISGLNQHIQETFSISGFILMKIFTHEKAEYGKFEETNRQVIKLQIRESLAGRWFFMTLSIFTTIGPLLIYLYGGFLFIRGEITIGVIIAFIALLQRLYGPVTQLSNIHIDVTRSLALFQRVFEYFDKAHEIEDKPGAESIKTIAGNVAFEQVYFSYNKEIEVLQDISLMSPSIPCAGASASSCRNPICSTIRSRPICAMATQMPVTKI